MTDSSHIVLDRMCSPFSLLPGKGIYYDLIRALVTVRQGTIIADPPTLLNNTSGVFKGNHQNLHPSSREMVPQERRRWQPHPWEVQRLTNSVDGQLDVARRFYSTLYTLEDPDGDIEAHIARM
ncbi:hypothetical protein DFQ27_001681, partial [Actinomortierella ambigua]